MEFVNSLNKGRTINLKPTKNCKIEIENFGTIEYRKTRHMKTEYIHFPCNIIELDGEIFPYGFYELQIPLRTSFVSLYALLKKENKLTGKVTLAMNQLKRGIYLWTIL